MHWNLGRIYLHLKSNTKLTTLPTLCDTGKLECCCSFISLKTTRNSNCLQLFVLFMLYFRKIVTNLQSKLS